MAKNKGGKSGGPSKSIPADVLVATQRSRKEHQQVIARATAAQPKGDMCLDLAPVLSTKMVTAADKAAYAATVKAERVLHYNYHLAVTANPFTCKLKSVCKLSVENMPRKAGVASGATQVWDKASRTWVKK